MTGREGVGINSYNPSDKGGGGRGGESLSWDCYFLYSITNGFPNRSLTDCSRPSAKLI